MANAPEQSTGASGHADRSLRVAFVVHQYPPNYFTGTESYAHALARTLHAQASGAIEVEVFAFEPFLGEADDLAEESDEVVDGVPVHRIRKWQGLHPEPLRSEYDDPLMASRFGAWLDARKPDVVHAFHLRLLGVGLLGEARRRGIAVAVHLMDFWYLCPRVTLERRDGRLCDGPPAGGVECLDCIAPERVGDAQAAAHLDGRRLRLRDELVAADAVFAPSRFLRRKFADNGVAEAHTTLFPYGIDLDVDARPSAPPTNRALRIGYAGSIAEHKGVDILVRAFGRLQADDSVQALAAAPELHVYGRLEDFPDYADRIRSSVAALPDPSRVHLHGAFARADRARTLSDLDVLVVPSTWYENTPFVVLEAQACGVPVVASDLGGLAEIVRHEIDGELFAARDDHALGQVLIRLATEPQRLARYRSNLPEVATVDDNARQLAEEYRRLAGRSAAPNRPAAGA